MTRPVPRPATADDAAEITRLRSQLVLNESLDEEWLVICRNQLAHRLRPEGGARACFVDAPGGGLAACALAPVHPVLSAPKYPKGLAARIHVVATEPASVGGTQRFLSAFSGISPRFRPRRHLMTATDYRAEMTVRFAIRNQITGSTGLPTTA